MEKELTKVELQIMKVVWSRHDEMQAGEITELVNDANDKKWKVNTVSTYLARLVEKQFLERIRVAKTYVYKVLISEKEYREMEMNRFVRLWGRSNPIEFMSSLNMEQPMTEEEKDLMRKWLDELD